jgi:hypothetical protein
VSFLRKQRCLCLFLPLLLCIIAALSYLTYSNQDKLIDYYQTISSRVINSTHNHDFIKNSISQNINNLKNSVNIN